MNRQSVKVRLDPGTHVVILLFMSALVLLADTETQFAAVVLLGLLYVLVLGLVHKALQYVLLFVCLKAAGYALSGITFGTFAIVLYTFSRMIPMMMIASALMASSPSAIIGAFERMRLPKKLTIAICILIRFFPIILEEMRSIRIGMRARGIFKNWYSMLQKPAFAYECFLVPLVIRCLKLSSELAASAVLRGIECTAVRSTAHSIGFRRADGVAMLLFLVSASGIYMWV